MAAHQAPQSITREWVQDYLKEKYPKSTFSVPAYFQIQLSSAQFPNGVVGITQFLFGNQPTNVNTVIIGSLDILFTSGSDQYGMQVFIQDLNYSGTNDDSVIIYDQYLDSVSTPNVNIHFSKEYHFDCIEFSNLLFFIADSVVYVQVVINGFKVSNSS